MLTVIKNWVLMGHDYPTTNEGLQLGYSGQAWDKFWLGQGSTFSSGGYWTLRSRDSDRQVMELVSSSVLKKILWICL